MVERVQGFCHLKLKLKRCVSHFFFFFYLNFDRYWRQYDLNRPISTISANTTRFSSNLHESRNEKKMRRDTNTQAATSPAAHCIRHRCSTSVATLVLQRVFPLCISYTIWSWVDCGPTCFVLATIPTHHCFSIQPSQLPPFCFLLQSNPIVCTKKSLILQQQQQEDSLYNECLCSSIQVEIPPLLPILLL